MISYQENASSSITSKSTRQSVYQTNGRPLSEEAIYKAKLKYGIYNNPAKVNLGVDPSASDTAALLASSSDLSVHPYKRELSSEAATAALIAKTDSAPRAWKRNSFAPEAEYAAISAKSQKYPFYDVASETVDFEESQDAASSVLKKSSASTARSALQDLYDFDDIRSGKTTLSQAKTAGSTQKTNAYDASKTYDINQLLKSATTSANRSMTIRTSPESMDARSGLSTANAYHRANGAVDISKITSSAEQSALKSMSTRLNPARDSSRGLLTASDNQNNEKFASVGALASQKFNPTPDYAAEERATLARNTLIDSKVLLKAISNSNATLDRIDNKALNDNLFSNKEWNMKAVEIAQANFIKRQSQTAGKINLGAGLLLSADEINKLAASVVQPILTDLDNKAEQQRNYNLEAEKRHAELKQKRSQYFVKQKEAKIAVKQKREADKQARRTKLQADKDALKEEQKQMTAEKQALLDEKEQELKDKMAEEEAARQEVDKERSDKLAVIKGIKDEKDAERKAELDGMQAEKDEDVAPLLEELEKETAILNDLIAKRAEAEAFNAEHKARFENGSAKLESTLDKLEKISKRIEETEAELATATTDAEREVAESELAKEQADLDHEVKSKELDEYVAVREKLSTEREETEAKRVKLLEELKTEKLAAKEEEKAINATLPEHLQKDISDDISDEESVDAAQFELDDSSIHEPPEIESEPEEEEKIDYGFNEKEEEPVAAVPEVSTEESTEEPSASKGVAPKKSEPAVPKRTWEEIKALGSFEPGSDPLRTVPTNEKPAMASVVTDHEVRAAATKTIDKPVETKTAKKSTVTSSTPASSAAAARSSAAPAEKKEGFGKKFIKFMTSEPPKPQKRVKKTTSSSNVKAKAAPKAAEPATKPVDEVKKEEELAKPAETTDGGELQTTFSNFSQGSEIEEAPKAETSKAEEA